MYLSHITWDIATLAGPPRARFVLYVLPLGALKLLLGEGTLSPATKSKLSRSPRCQQNMPRPGRRDR